MLANNTTHFSRPSLPKRKLGPPMKKIYKKFEIFTTPNYQIQKKKLAPTKEIFVGSKGRQGGGNIPWEIKILIQATRKLMG